MRKKSTFLPFPNIAFFIEEVNGCINEEFADTINEEVTIRAAMNPLS